MLWITLRCPACEARIKAPAKIIDHSRKCPACGARLVVRPEAPLQAGPLLVPDSIPQPPHRKAG
jgi:uncharacterized paraquat-inducible protein A